MVENAEEGDEVAREGGQVAREGGEVAREGQIARIELLAEDVDALEARPGETGVLFPGVFEQARRSIDAQVLEIPVEVLGEDAPSRARGESGCC